MKLFAKDKIIKTLKTIAIILGNIEVQHIVSVIQTIK